MDVLVIRGVPFNMCRRPILMAARRMGQVRWAPMYIPQVLDLAAEDMIFWMVLHMICTVKSFMGFGNLEG